MFKTLTNAFKVKEVRNRLLFTFVMLVVIRFGCQLPVPGVNRDFFSQWFEQQTAGTFGFFDAFTGGSFLRMSVLALNITPYITSSIIMQLLTIAIPALEEMHKDGEDGRKKMNKITRYLTVVLGLIESGSMAIAFAKQGTLGADYNALSIITMITALTSGAVLVMWLGERITESGIGNGMSIILLTNIVSRMPNDFYVLYEQFMKGKQIGPALIAGVIIAGVVIFTVVFVIILSDGERHIPIQYSKKIQGRKMVGGQSSHIPLKVNTAGVIPIIFASSILQFPLIIQNLFNYQNNGVIGKILVSLSSSSWFDVDHPLRSLGLVVYIVLVILFAYFYTSITFNPIEVSNNMKKQGGFIPGIRPGKPTQEYLNRLLNYIIFIGAAGLVIVAVIPFFFNGIFSANVSFGGTSLIIVVGVILETKKQIESQILVRKYTGFLND